MYRPLVVTKQIDGTISSIIYVILNTSWHFALTLQSISIFSLNSRSESITSKDESELCCFETCHIYRAIHRFGQAKTTHDGLV